MRSVLSICLFLLVLTSVVSAQCLPGDTLSLGGQTDSLFKKFGLPLSNLTTFYTTPMDTNERIIFLIPGLGGNVEAWSDVTDETNGITYDYQAYPPRKAHAENMGGNNNPGYSQNIGLAHAGGEVYNKMTNFNYAAFGVSNVKDNIVIAHSQGGLVARAVDYHMHRNGRTPKFGGLVTFGSPHQGAEILTNGLPVAQGGRGMIQDFANDMCKDLSAGPTLEFLNNSDNMVVKLIRFLNLESNVLDLEASICDILSDTIMPLLLGDYTTPITQDYMAHNEYYSGSNYLLDTLNNYQTTIPMVAFYGVEQEPVVWRQFGSMMEKVHTYPAFQADPDQHHVDRVSDLFASYNASYIKYKLSSEHFMRSKNLSCNLSGIAGVIGTFWSPAFLISGAALAGCLINGQKALKHHNISSAYRSGYRFLFNANPKWKVIIGAYEIETKQNGYLCDCEYLQSGSVTRTLVQNQSSCPTGVTNGPQGKVVCQSYPNWETKVITKENDGVVLAESAGNLPGAIVNPNLAADDYKLESTNHQQLRNSSETAKKLIRLFESIDYSNFFITTIR